MEKDKQLTFLLVLILKNNPNFQATVYCKKLDHSCNGIPSYLKNID